MPSRSRRGGPGVGISDVDTNILETLRRRRENEPLIPAHAQFLLTTNAARVRTLGESSDAEDGDNESGSQLNTWAYERYFDKPEVIRAYREQQLIQTPEYTLLSEHEAVGGRFRPRSLDDEGIDTSDGAYEKRHRKYETFEKRQRLREKEKLKHEHYKLKERIEQLRALEPSAFLSASDSFFAGSLHTPPQQGNSDAEGGTTDAPAPVHNEGEWRKRQMLDVANSLDARYRTLLDTAPSRAPDLQAPTPPPPTPAPPAPAPAPASSIPASPLIHTPNHIPNTTVRRSPGPTPGPARTTSPTGPRPQRVPPTSLPPADVIELDSDGEEATEFVKAESMTSQPIPVRHDTTESLKLRIKFPNRQPPALSSSQRPPPSSPSSPRLSAARIASSSPNPKASGSASGSSSPSRPRPKPIFRNPAAPSQYVRIPFMKPVQPQDGIAATAVDDTTPSIPSSLSPRQTASPALSSNSATHLTLRRRPARATGHPMLEVLPLPPPRQQAQLHRCQSSNPHTVQVVCASGGALNSPTKTRRTDLTLMTAMTTRSMVSTMMKREKKKQKVVARKSGSVYDGAIPHYTARHSATRVHRVRARRIAIWGFSGLKGSQLKSSICTTL
ncbi:hypothetical protein BGY98DRAFT_227842 [Russula aff. rugulosa BPL654]|nr:hypothetical protein BGY98DRAFT_227842 [Russula aff. rugulosa BPL654]